MQHRSIHFVTRSGRRSTNEDAAWMWTSEAWDPRVSVLAVADGMGGHEHGEKASEIAIQAVQNEVEDWSSAPDARDDLQVRCAKVFDRIDEALQIYSQRHAEVAEMGTTLVMAVVIDQLAFIAHIGDSRAYWISQQGAVTQLTRDHNAAAEAVREGRMTEEEAARSPYRHALTRCLDASGESTPEFTTHQIQGPGFLCLCTDGLTGSLEDEDFTQVLLRDLPLSGSVQALVDLAFERGSKDNLTLASMECGRVERKGKQAIPSSNQALADEGPGRTSSSGLISPSSPSKNGAPQWAMTLLGLTSALLVVMICVYVVQNSSKLSGFNDRVNQVIAAFGLGGAPPDSTSPASTPVDTSAGESFNVQRGNYHPQGNTPENEAGEEKTSPRAHRDSIREFERIGQGGEKKYSDDRESNQEERGVNRDPKLDRELGQKGFTCKVVFANSSEWKMRRMKKYKKMLAKKINVSFGPFKEDTLLVSSSFDLEVGDKKVDSGILKKKGVLGVVKEEIEWEDKPQRPRKHCFKVSQK